MLPLRYSARPAGERHGNSAGEEPGAFILSLLPHWQEKRGTKNIYPFFNDVPSSSENILNVAEPSFHAMSQQIILDSTQVFIFILSRYFWACSTQEASVCHTVWNKLMICDLPGRNLSISFWGEICVTSELFFWDDAVRGSFLWISTSEMGNSIKFSWHPLDKRFSRVSHLPWIPNESV